MVMSTATVTAAIAMATATGTVMGEANAMWLHSIVAAMDNI